jgi:hypothetical protein
LLGRGAATPDGRTEGIELAAVGRDPGLSCGLMMKNSMRDTTNPAKMG